VSAFELFTGGTPPTIEAHTVDGQVVVAIGAWDGHDRTIIGLSRAEERIELRLPAHLLRTLHGMTRDEIRIHLDDTYLDGYKDEDRAALAVYFDEVRVLAEAIAAACEAAQP
jgi:hypothetical protein